MQNKFDLNALNNSIQECHNCVLDNLSENFWRGIGNFNYNLNHVINEFLDNSVANISALHKNSVSSGPGQININIVKLDEGFVFRIEDNGSGIEDIANALSLGGDKKRFSSLNEHGFGLKTSLATVDKTNKKWRVVTRTDSDFEKGQYRIVQAPYIPEMSVFTIDENKLNWPGVLDTTGTIVEFVCTEGMFNTLQEGIRGNASEESCVQYLCEQIGSVYRYFIENNEIKVTVEFDGKKTNVKPVFPVFVEGRNTGKQSVLLNVEHGTLHIDFIFGEIEEAPYKRYYKRNMATNGVEFIVNGRKLMGNLFSEIWPLRNHPSYNSFIGVVNITSDDIRCLPKTNTAKNGIDKSDPVYQAVINWIRSSNPTPLKQVNKAIREEDLVQELERKLNNEISAVDKFIQREFGVFQSCYQQVAVDLYCFNGKKTTIYEAKKLQAEPLDLYQLRMYWDGAVEDGIPIDEGVLIAASFSDNLQDLVNRLNGYIDPRGNTYNFRLAAWSGEGVFLN